MPEPIRRPDREAPGRQRLPDSLTTAARTRRTARNERGTSGSRTANSPEVRRANAGRRPRTTGQRVDRRTEAAQRRRSRNS